MFCWICTDRDHFTWTRGGHALDESSFARDLRYSFAWCSAAHGRDRRRTVDFTASLTSSGSLGCAAAPGTSGRVPTVLLNSGKSRKNVILESHRKALKFCQKSNGPWIMTNQLKKKSLKLLGFSVAWMLAVINILQCAVSAPITWLWQPFPFLVFVLHYAAESPI